MKHNQKGFTLIELLVVVAIIGLLASVVIVSLNNARSKARDAKRVADVKTIQSALEMYYSDYGGYPNASSGTPTGTTWGTTYMNAWPTVPTPADGTCGTSNAYTYAGSGTSFGTSPILYPSYTVDFCIGAQTGTLQSGKKQASPTGIVHVP